MPPKRDYYEILGVGRDAAPEEIRRAYRRGALKYHPDQFRGDKAEAERRFKELAESYEVLGDPAKRHTYDRYGHAGLRGAGMHDFSSMGFGDIFSMFQDIFGGLGAGFAAERAADRGYDLETEVELTLEQVATGSDQTLEFARMDFCDTCGGSGAKPGTRPSKCSACGGYGQMHQQIQGFFGVSIRVTACPRCRGKGVLVTDPCGDCRGSGRRKKKRVLSVHVPPGVHDGQVVRIREEGEPASSGTGRGDLHCYVRIRPHPFLVRQGDDLICRVPISFSQAALGATVQVPTLVGAESLEIRPGTQHGDVFTIKNRGLPSQRSGRTGDQQVQVVIEVPKKLMAKQRELLEAFAKTEDANVSPQRKSFLKTLTDYFAARK
ncbi:MAG: molecular chaperone DnaJ [Phycisphaerae bacterium]|nr:molecular chaperone DnaJ [Phycisphaerae bacterium]